LRRLVIYLQILIFTFIILTGCSENADSSVSSASLTSTSVLSTTSTTTLDTTSLTSDTTVSSSETTTNKTQPPSTTTQKSTQPTTAKTTVATTPPPAPPPIIIPTILTPTSPATEVYSTEFATIDVSNKSQGYFTARYTGTNATVKLLVTKDGQRYSYNLNSQGNTEVFPLQMGSGVYNIFIGELVSGTSYALAIQQDIDVGLANASSVYLYPSQQVNFSQGSLCVKKSAEVCAGKSSDLEKIGAIFDYIVSNVSYDTGLAAQITSGEVTSYTPNPDATIQKRIGICYDYAALFAAMTRAQGIPTKMIFGYVGEGGLYHAWNQVYTSQAGWINVEIKFANAGFNTLDATFYSGATNKSSVVGNFSNANYYKVHKVF